ncbi:MAG TPA: alpha/beta fold hydrolase [Streptosporangiaceae bacterium]|nr:alpha/beta fold hydrolase [Streptosporangiaceae bacterium]
MGLAYERHGSGPPLVLLHGVGHRRQAWDAVLDRLAPHRDVILIDLPGHGESPPLRLDGQPSLTVMLDAVTGLLDELGVTRPHFAGNSLGGRLSLEAGVAGRAATVTALSPAGFWRSRAEMLYGWAVFKIMEATGAWTRPLAPALARSALGRAVVFSAIVSRPARLSPQQALGDIMSFTAATDAINLILTDIGNFTGRVPEGIPVTIGWGSRDRLLFPRQARLVKAQLPEARLVRLPGCGHVPMTDDPALVADVLLRGSARA